MRVCLSPDEFFVKVFVYICVLSGDFALVEEVCVLCLSCRRGLYTCICPNNFAILFVRLCRPSLMTLLLLSCASVLLILNSAHLNDVPWRIFLCVRVSVGFVLV